MYGIALIVVFEVFVDAVDVERVDVDGVGVGRCAEVAATVVHRLIKTCVVMRLVELPAILLEGRVVEHGAEEIAADG